MEPWSIEFRGTVNEHTITSEVLQGNVLGDPHERPLSVYTPPGYDPDAETRYPTIVVIQGLTGQVDMWWNRSAFRANSMENTDRLFAEEGCPPAIVAFVDAWTSIGGSQYVNSPGTGRYLDYLCDEVVPFVDENYRTYGDREHRGIAGKSSGGYGAMVVPMLRPDMFAGLATHCGDALFEVCYQPDFREASRVLRDDYEGEFSKFWEDFHSRPAMSKKHDGLLLNVWCMAACYSAEEDGTVTLPFDDRTGRLIPEVWERWLALDPVRMAPKNAETLSSMRAIYIDAGKWDEYYLDLGAEAFAEELDAIGVEYFFELYDAGHMQVEYRYPIGLRYLAERLG